MPDHQLSKEEFGAQADAMARRIVDALTGEGLGLAFGAAEVLVDCVATDRTADYDRRWRALTRRYRLLTAGLLHATGIPPVRAAITPASAALPTVFTRVVNALGE